jgi:RND family efflux transporter MFP subunit
MRVSTKRALPPLLILAGGFLLSGLLLEGRPSAEPMPRTTAPQPVRTLDVEPRTIRLFVESQGTVTPRTESQLVAEVAGRVRSVGAGLEPGAFFERGEVLAELDDGDLALDVKRAGALLERAAAEEEFARTTLARLESLARKGIASDAALDEARRAARTTRASRLEAEVNLARAERDLDRARIVAPFAGRTVSRSIDKGRFLSVGTPIAILHAAEDAEIRLPVPDGELAFLDLPIGREIPRDEAPRVTLRSRFAGREHAWEGRIVRTEAQIDPRTRMVNVVARVDRSDAGEDEQRPPLTAGLFVEAHIEGRAVDGLVRIPRAALADESSVWVVDRDRRLRRRPIEVLRVERSSVLVSDGLAESDLVSLLEPRLAREGLTVEPIREDTIARSRDVGEPAS